MTFNNVGPLYQDVRSGSVGGLTRFSPVSPEQGMYVISDSLKPACRKKPFNLPTISSKRSLDQLTVSNLLITTPS